MPVSKRVVDQIASSYETGENHTDPEYLEQLAALGGDIDQPMDSR